MSTTILIGDRTGFPKTATRIVETVGHARFKRTAEQASSLEETASSLEELTSTVTQNAEHTSVIKVTNGSELVSEAGRTMNEIVNSVKKVNDIIAEIAAASGEQSSGIEQVNQAVVQMDGVTQQNAAMVEEASATASAMEEQARVLTDAVSVFKIAGAAHKSQPVRIRQARVDTESSPREVQPASAFERPTPRSGSKREEPMKSRKLKVVDANAHWTEF